MKGKAGIFLGCVLVVLRALVCAGTVQAQQSGTLTLEGVIIQAAKAVEGGVPAGAKLAVLNFSSSSEVFSDYVIEELTGVLVTNKKVTVIERRSLDLVRKEMNLQLSGDVSDDSAQAIGKQLGAQVIVSGSLTNLGNVYRFRIKVINVETARIEVQASYNMGNDQQVTFLLHGSQGNAPPVVSAPGTPGTAQTAGKPSAPAPVAGKVYKIGDTGPAGGLIFYDKGSNSEGWRYLEAASQDAGSAIWGAFGTAIGNTGIGLGAGKQNTQTIADYLKGDTNSAAVLCLRYSQGGYSDWFLPSRAELNLMWLILKSKGQGSFKDQLYWSSSESNQNDVLVQRFDNGSMSSVSKLGMFIVRGVRAFSSTEAPAQAAKTYQIGDTGPAGGFVFYDKGSYSDGWRYLEAASRDAGTAPWGPYETVGKTETGIGTGKQNTQRIVNYLAGKGENTAAAILCLQYSQGGYSDWFLPSKDELYLMYWNVKQRGLGGMKDANYWSSSENYGSLAWRQSFSDGRQDNNAKNYTFVVRAIRAF